VNIFTRFGFTHDGVLDEELFLEIVTNLVGGHNESEGGLAIDETRRDDLATNARSGAHAIGGTSREL